MVTSGVLCSMRSGVPLQLSRTKVQTLLGPLELTFQPRALELGLRIEGVRQRALPCENLPQDVVEMIDNFPVDMPGLRYKSVTFGTGESPD